MNRPPRTVQPAVPIEFVPERGAEWANLPKFWNPPPTDAEKAAAALALVRSRPVAPLAETQAVVQIKVPAGLDDPRPYILRLRDPPTLDKWELGRRLFYDRPCSAKASSRALPATTPTPASPTTASATTALNTPTLVNCVFNRRQFWDGRVAALEEVVQRTPEDETAPPARIRSRSATSGAASCGGCGPAPATRSCSSTSSATPPTQDAVGKALATYLRTLLADDSVHDRAVRVTGGRTRPAARRRPLRKGARRGRAEEAGLGGASRRPTRRSGYTEGYRLFHDLEEHKAGCVRCHGGREFTDGGFHNLGVGFQGRFRAGPGAGPIRLAAAGREGPALIGAYKTPTLRGLLRTGPYFHDGSAATLEEAVRFHTDGGRLSAYLDRDLLPRDVPSAEFADLILFLRALEGTEVDPAVGPAPP